MKRLAMIIAVMAFAVAASAGEFTVLRVVDGDTIVVWDGVGIRPGDSCMVLHQDEYGRTIPCPDQGHETIVRLTGIDTPELHANDKAERDAEEWDVTVEEINKAGRSAKYFVNARIGVAVTLATTGIDIYGRTLAYVFLADGRCLNEALIKNGVALERYKHDRSEEFKALEREAREKRLGFWKTIWRNHHE